MVFRRIDTYGYSKKWARYRIYYSRKTAIEPIIPLYSGKINEDLS